MPIAIDTKLDLIDRAYHIKLRIIQSLWLSGKRRDHIRAYAHCMNQLQYNQLLDHESKMKQNVRHYFFEERETIDARIKLLRYLKSIDFYMQAVRSIPHGR